MIWFTGMGSEDNLIKLAKFAPLVCVVFFEGGGADEVVVIKSDAIGSRIVSNIQIKICLKAYA